MPAHLKTLILTCRSEACPAKATVAVFDRWNGSRGVYCRFHGKTEVDRLNRLEDDHKS